MSDARQGMSQYQATLSDDRCEPTAVTKPIPQALEDLFATLNEIEIEIAGLSERLAPILADNGGALASEPSSENKTSSENGEMTRRLQSFGEWAERIRRQVINLKYRIEL